MFIDKQRCYNSLVALSVADAYGENFVKSLPAFAYKAGNVAGMREDTIYWPWSDDTAMAIGIVRQLFKHGKIGYIELAQEFAANYKADPMRGYGKGTAGLLKYFEYDAENWEIYSKTAFGELGGSYGNGAAMRIAPLGAYKVSQHWIANEAYASAIVTHYNDDAAFGAIAVAIAASIATYNPPEYFWKAILDNTPEGEVRSRIETVSKLPDASNWDIVGLVGNGRKISALDTVPYALWCAYRGLIQRDFARIMEYAVEVGGDTDTYCAMIGGIIGNAVPPPQEWIDRTEPLPGDLIP